MRINKAWLAGIQAVVLWIFFSSGTLLACSTCWSSFFHSAEGLRMADGFRNGILFLLLTPFALAGTIGYRIYKAQFRQQSGGASRELPRGH